MGVNTLIQIGNSDDRLTQKEWARFVMELRDLLHNSVLQIHGEWYAKADEPWQNANFTVEILPPMWWRSAVQRAGQQHPVTMGVYPNPEDSPSAVHMRDREMAKARNQLKEAVKRLCYRWRQDSFAWTTAPVEIVETGWAQDRETERESWPELEAREMQARELAMLYSPSRRHDGEWSFKRGGIQFPMDPALKEAFDQEVPPVPQDNRSLRQGGPGLQGWFPPGKTHLNDEDRENLLHGGPPPEMVDAMKRLRQELGEAVEQKRAAQQERLLSTPGPEPASDQQQPALTGVLVPCTDERCLLTHDVDVRLVFGGCVMSSPDNRAQAKIEQWGELKPAWREGLGLPPLSPGEPADLAEAIATVDEKLTTPTVIVPEAPAIPGWDVDAHDHAEGVSCPVVDCIHNDRFGKVID